MAVQSAILVTAWLLVTSGVYSFNSISGAKCSRSISKSMIRCIIQCFVPRSPLKTYSDMAEKAAVTGRYE